MRLTRKTNFVTGFCTHFKKKNWIKQFTKSFTTPTPPRFFFLLDMLNYFLRQVRKRFSLEVPPQSQYKSHNLILSRSITMNFPVKLRRVTKHTYYELPQTYTITTRDIYLHISLYCRSLDFPAPARLHSCLH